MAQELLDQALAEAHLPALLMSLIHITGDAGLLDEFPRPAYDFFADSRTGGYTPDVQAKLRAHAKDVLQAFQSGDKKLPPPPSTETATRMMNFVSGADIPSH